MWEYVNTIFLRVLDFESCSLCHVKTYLGRSYLVSLHAMKYNNNEAGVIISSIELPAAVFPWLFRLLKGSYDFMNCSICKEIFCGKAEIFKMIQTVEYI